MRRVAALIVIGSIAAVGLAIAQDRLPISTNGSDPATWKPAQDALKAAPKNHVVIFENDDIRVISVTVQAGETETHHHHRWPSVMVVDRLVKLADFDEAGKEIKLPFPENPELPLIVRIPPQALHSAKNIDDKPFHAIRIEFKKGFPSKP